MPKYTSIPLLPLKGMTVFPSVVLHFDVAHPRSMAALEAAMLNEQDILLVAQHDEDVEVPDKNDLYEVGTVAKIKQVLNLPGESLRVLVEGMRRAKIVEVNVEEKYSEAKITFPRAQGKTMNNEMIALSRTLQGVFEEFCKASMRVSSETLKSINNIEDPSQMTDVIASNALTDFEERQEILETINLKARMELLITILMRELELFEVERQVQTRLKMQLDKHQKDYFLREQIKAINTELGEDELNELEQLKQRAKTTPMNDEAKEKVERELERLARMPQGTPEMTISRSYVEWILDLPWGKQTKDRLDLKKARKVLDENHCGLEEVKERIIEYLAVLRMKKDMKGPILCFVGPPGVGKTSIVRSVANAVGREFVQMSLGGVRDEAEIRGHRRTYIGAIPGRIIAGIKQAKTMNPVFLFDEIDKMASDFRGDPASAMLEVLDGEQNNAFRDHYLEIPFDISRVMFITTANTVETIPPALLDRLEIIEVSSYTDQEKLMIAKKHLWPKQLESHGLKPKSVKISDSLLADVIEGYTREAGVRTLERVIAKLVRKATVEMIDEKKATITIDKEKIIKYLGAEKYSRERLDTGDVIGVVNGLAYTTVGGVMLPVECMIMEGNGVLQLTGKLGEVMQESAKAALSWVRSYVEEKGVEPSYFKQHDIHIHVPEGAVPKDGPSAGVTMITALVSAVLGIAVKQSVAMTGEISLRGRVMPIGGLKEKLIAAYRSGIKTVLIPKDNSKDLEDVPEVVREKLIIHPVENVTEVLSYALIDTKNDDETVSEA